MPGPDPVAWEGGGLGGVEGASRPDGERGVWSTAFAIRNWIACIISAWDLSRASLSARSSAMVSLVDAVYATCRAETAPSMIATWFPTAEAELNALSAWAVVVARRSVSRVISAPCSCDWYVRSSTFALCARESSWYSDVPTSRRLAVVRARSCVNLASTRRTTWSCTTLAIAPPCEETAAAIWVAVLPSNLASLCSSSASGRTTVLLPVATVKSDPSGPSSINFWPGFSLEPMLFLVSPTWAGSPAAVGGMSSRPR